MDRRRCVRGCRIVPGLGWDCESSSIEDNMAILFIGIRWSSYCIFRRAVSI